MLFPLGGILVPLLPRLGAVFLLMGWILETKSCSVSASLEEIVPEMCKLNIRDTALNDARTEERPRPLKQRAQLAQGSILLTVLHLTNGLWIHTLDNFSTS